MDEVWTNIRYDRVFREANLLCFTETWLSENVLNESVKIDGFTLIRGDRTKQSGKDIGGGVCLFVNKRWCNITIVRDKQCTPDIELLTISLRPFYCPREFPQLFVTVVYIHPKANSTRAAEILSENTHKLETLSPDAPRLILGDFNQHKLGKVLRIYHQYVTCPTRKDKTIDLCYGTVPSAYRSVALPPLGASDHNCVNLIPKYVPVIQRKDKIVKTVKLWTLDSIERLRGCFECTDWQVFYESSPNLNEMADVITSYVNYCVDSVIPKKEVVVFANNKPWVTKELKDILNKKKRIFYQGTTHDNKQINKEVKVAVRKAKDMYKRKIENKFSSGCIRSAWQGIKHMASINTADKTQRNKINVEGIDDQALPDRLNDFFARFEKHNLKDDTVGNNDPHVDEIIISEDHVRTLLRNINVNKSSGPDGIEGRTLKSCADQLSGVLRYLFQTSINQCVVPNLWKESIIKPIPKQTVIKQLNDLRPIALTSLVMKIFKKIVKTYITSVVESKLDPLQFAYSWSSLQDGFGSTNICLT
ncbi:uncharacterized protein [Antedon mediterranea]|uniref:uncharacterized protein n=1 Tax=Antedon mediterranea TaxID=105859 RepID=UPI003AF796C8